MGWKNIEMQIAIPRTQDAGRLQELQTKNQQRFQENLQMHQLKQEELKRQQVQDLKETTQEKIRKDIEKERQNAEQQAKKDQKRNRKKTKQKFSHPYLGRFIDDVR